MRIGVEASAIARSEKTGVPYYSYHIIRATTRLMPKDTFELAYIGFGKKKVSTGFDESNVADRRISFLPSKIYDGLFRYLVAPPFDLLANVRSDVFIFPNFVRWPLLWARKSIVVVYDLSYLNASDHSQSRHRSFLTKWVPISIRKSDHVVVISENTKKEVMEAYATNEADITVIYPAVDHDFFRPSTAQVAGVQKKYGITKPYILSLCTIEPRKNLVGLLNAYSQLPADIKESHTLVLAGGKGWLDGEISVKYEEISRDYDVVMTGYVDEADLPALYSGAKVFAYPSFYEGFGMPPLEAMACGTPVITSNNSSLPEVVGDAGIMVDAHDTAALADAIAKVVTDPELAKKMRAAGIERAKRFDWTTEGAKLKNILERLGRKG